LRRLYAAGPCRVTSLSTTGLVVDVGRAHRDIRGALAEDLALNAIGIHGPKLAPWPCGVLNAGETPNLMLGTAGIGHFLLRLHDGDRTPAIAIILPAPDSAG